MNIPLTHEKTSHLFMAFLFIGTGYLLCRLISPFWGAVVGAVALGISFYPFHLWIEEKIPQAKRWVRALISDLAVFVFIISPLFLMTLVTVEQSHSWSPVVKSWQENVGEWQEGKIVDSSTPMKSLRGWLYRTFSVKPSEFRREVAKLADRALESVVKVGSGLAAGVFVLVGNLGLMIFILFFVFRDGQRIYSYLESFLPLREEQKRELRDRGRLMIAGVVRGWLFGAVLQGGVAAVGYLVTGVQAWMFFGFLTMVTGLLPVIGTALVWVPLSVNAFIQGDIWQGIFLLGWGTAVVGLVDNVLRPYLMGKGSDVSFLYLFFALLGGIEIWGVKGIILGPVIVAIAPVIFEIYKQRYLVSPNDSVTSPIRQTPAPSVLEPSRRKEHV